MNNLLKKMTVVLLSLGLAQAVWADNVQDFKEMLQVAEQGDAAAQYNLGLMYYKGKEFVKTTHRQYSGFIRQQSKEVLLPNIIWV